MQNRGPDGEGTWLSKDTRIAMAYRRLSIIGLGEQGHQPMILSKGCKGYAELAITFNGEIYNYQYLRSKLTQLGHHFVTQTDTEVILHMYEEYGIRMVTDLRGMFAFALWDQYHKELHIVRDPYGIKPLYMADDGKTLRIASQVKALLAGGVISRSVDEGALAGFFLFGSVPEPKTVWSDIEALPAGSIMSISSYGKRNFINFASPNYTIASVLKSIPLQSTSAVAAAAFHESAGSHLVSDVDVCLFLPSGIDSTALLSLATDMG